MADPALLDGYDPYDVLDDEAARIEAHARTLDAAAWDAPSGCDGWSVRDVLAHLAATEFYFHACLDGTVADLLGAGAQVGLTSLDDFNELGVSSQRDHDPSDVLEHWRRANERTRRDLRARDGEQIDTSIGAYPLRLQAFHVAAELATHADDMGVPVPARDRERRAAWRAAVARFALSENKPGAEIEAGDGRTRVRIGDVDVELDDATLRAAVDGRLGPDSELGEAERTALRITP